MLPSAEAQDSLPHWGLGAVGSRVLLAAYVLFAVDLDISILGTVMTFAWRQVAAGLVSAAFSADDQSTTVTASGANDALLTLMYDVASGRTEQPVRTTFCPVGQPCS